MPVLVPSSLQNSCGGVQPAAEAITRAVALGWLARPGARQYARGRSVSVSGGLVEDLADGDPGRDPATQGGLEVIHDDLPGPSVQELEARGQRQYERVRHL